MKNNKKIKFASQLHELQNGKLEGGFTALTSHLNHIVGGVAEGTNNCNGGNCVPGCGQINTVDRCGSVNSKAGCGTT
jgi:hypothetical protein